VNSVGRQATGNLAGVVATQTISQDGKTKHGIDEYAVFIMIAYPAAISAAAACPVDVRHVERQTLPS
jgi:hypothetical protein